MAYKAKQMIVMRRDLKMRKGKIAAQAGHACVEATLTALVRENRLTQVRATEDGWVYLEDEGVEPSPLSAWLKRVWLRFVCMLIQKKHFSTSPNRDGKKGLHTLLFVMQV